MSFRFRMYLANGEDLDDYVSAVPNWNPGDTVYIDGRPRYRISCRDPGEQPRQRGRTSDRCDSHSADKTYPGVSRRATLLTFSGSNQLDEARAAYCAPVVRQYVPVRSGCQRIYQPLSKH
jgi:hypothetical protein